MRKFVSVVVASSYCAIALASSGSSLGVTAAELERLGVELAKPVRAPRIEIASAPAEVVIPPAQQTIVGTTVSGVLVRLTVAEGDSVEPGQALAEIRSAELLELEKSFVDAAAAAELARAQLERDRGLHADGIVAERRLQESVVAARAAETAVDQARQQLLIAGLTEGEVGRLENTRELDATLRLRAPFAAVVIGQLHALGAHVDPLEPILSLADLDTLWLEAHVSQERAERIQPGMRLAAMTAAGPVDAAITHVGRVVDQTSQTVMVRGVVEEGTAGLRAGQVLTARILTSTSDGPAVLAVPSGAVVRDEQGAVVFVRTQGGVAAHYVEILAEQDGTIYVSAGLEPDAELAVSGVAALKSIWLSESGEDE